jgi:hypothetical protein
VCSASELVGGYPHALLVSAGGEVQLLFHLMELVLSSDGVIVGGDESRRPQLEETLQLPLEVIWRTPMMVKHPLSQCIQETGLAVHHLRQLWWRRRRCSFSKLLGGIHTQCGLLPGSKGSSSTSSMATAMTTCHRCGGSERLFR